MKDLADRAMTPAERRAAVAQADRPSAVYRPRIFIDGNMWCALYGDNLQDGVAGFGRSVAEAMADFNVNWRKRLVPFNDLGEPPRPGQK